MTDSSPIRRSVATFSFVLLVMGGLFLAVFSISPGAALLVSGLFTLIAVQYVVWGYWLGGLLRAEAEQANERSEA